MKMFTLDWSFFQKQLCTDDLQNISDKNTCKQIYEYAEEKSQKKSIMLS